MLLNEINLINTFEQYQTNSLTENIINIINKHLDKIIEQNVKTELLDLMLGHYNIMLSTFC